MTIIVVVVVRWRLNDGGGRTKW